jgi:Leucine-rich repeat (LRR) protein
MAIGRVPQDLQLVFLEQVFEIHSHFHQVCPLVCKLWRNLYIDNILPSFIANFRNKERQIPNELGLRSITIQFLEQAQGEQNKFQLGTLFRKFNADLKRAIGPNAAKQGLNKVEEVNALLAQDTKTNLHILWDKVKVRLRPCPSLKSCKEISEWMEQNQAIFTFASLDLSNLNLTAIPSQIKYLTQLTTLKVDNNQINRIPPEIGALVNLTEFICYDNELQDFPPEFAHLTQLVKLDCSYNSFQSIPLEIAKLNQLKILDFSNNKIQNIPAEIGTLVQLTELKLSHNQIDDFCLQIGKLSNLEYLFLNDNMISSIPREIENLINLKVLDLFNNEIDSLPVEIGKITRLITLNFSNNLVTVLPPEIGQLNQLISLDFTYNQIASICSDIEKFILQKKLNPYDEAFQNL